VVVYGTGASLLVENPNTLVYADLARWEIQLRFRKGMPNWQGANEKEDALRKFKRGYFFEWRMADRLKQKLYEKIDYLLDTNKKGEPKMVSGKDYRQALAEVVSQPFRLVPYFDASVWGGQWMKEKFNLDPSAENYGWAFDGVPEENSLLLRFGDTVIEIPAINAVHQFPDELLGKKVRTRFGKEFPIRFDYLDTVGGGNLSLQVHPMVEYIQEKFGMNYTQNESYYILDAKEQSTIYLGVKEGVSKDELFADLKKAENGDFRFPDEKYINCFPVKKHDHYSIPSGTIHCGGPETVVLEISQTPYIFTFKLWDWERVGLDGIPRPVHLEHGEKNVQIDYDTKWVKENLINPTELIEETDNTIIEKTGLNELELIETRRYWFSDAVEVQTMDSVNMLNLVEGEKITVESMDGEFEPFNVNYGETFIVPEQIKEYRLVNQGNPDKKAAVIQAFIRGL
jgi:mannose-6-phosphate isomerase class I